MEQVHPMTNTTKLRWGILGCARISRRGLIPGIVGSRTGSLVALASRDLATARAWSTEFGVNKACGSYEELLADSEVDAVYIPLPNELHKPWVFAAANAGKHILCEKPLALNQQEARAMVDHCADRNVVIVEAFMWRHQPRTTALRAMVAEGTIGELRLIRSSFSFPIDPGDWRLDPARGGGALWDIGCYGVSTVRLFAAGEPDVIQSLARFGPTGVDLSLTSEMRFPSGVLGLIDCSFEQPFRCSYELVGTRGSIDVPDAYLPPADRPVARLNMDGTTRELSFDGYNQYAAMVDAFEQAVRSGGEQITPSENGLAQMAVLDAVLAAARSV
jgi:D-xylose 1-dehydrogenase (NADP+, D-xylono-1,5-lactone-forming)